MALFHCRITHQIPPDMDPRIRADHLARHARYLRELAAAGVLRHLWRAAGTGTDIAVIDAVELDRLDEILSRAPLHRYLKIEATALVDHPDLRA